MAKKRERLEDTPEFMKKYGQALKRMDERNKTAEVKKSKLNKQDLNKLPGFAENYEESLIRQLFEEDLKKKIEKYLGEDDKESQYYQDSWELKHHKRDGLWDVKADEKIEYFDPELSYELTGYRPITMTEGLDFDPELFREAARIYEETGKYTEYPADCKPYNDYWMEQLKRCAEGYTVGKYRITGDHYFFLNFYHMQTVDKSANKKTRGRVQSFPRFLAKQYEFFHYVELCEFIGRDVVMLKARGLGFSEILADLCVRPFITTRQFRTVATADSDGHLDPLLDKCWTQLNWLNLHTDGGMKRSRQKIDNIKQKRASLLNKEGVEYGSMSEIEGIVADDPNKIRGDRVERLIYEECFGKDTLVIMSDYSRKPIQDIKVGDFVMGIDGTPQEVIHTCSGLDDLYLVKQRKGEDYVINSKHKIYTEFRPRIGNKPDVIELLTPSDYFSLSKYYKQTHYGLKSSGLQFNNQIDGIDFYYFGLWLGDGFSSGSKIVINETDDPEIKDFVLNYYSNIVKKYPNHQIKISANSTDKTSKILNNYSLTTTNHQGSIIYNWLKEHNEINNKHIFKKLLYLPINERLKILAGIIDTDGNLKKGSTSYSFSYEIAMSRKQLILDIQELAKSCGFDTSYNERIISQGYKKDSISYRVIIRGELRKIPVRIKRKQLPKDYVVTTNALSTSIKIEPFGYGEYYGFTLKAYNKPTDNLFLLNDYTIVHNCGSQPKLIKAWIQGNALVEIGGEKIGTRIAGGTGGDSGIALAGLSEMFNNPRAYNVLPYKNKYTRDGKIAYTGFFIPAHEFSLNPEFVDSRGVTDSIRFKQWYEEQRKKMEGQALLDYCAEHCFTPDEALLRQGDNIFDSIVISERLTQIRVFKENYQKPEPTALLWVGEERKFVKAQPLSTSKLLVVEPPLLDMDGNPYNNLYVAGIDAIDMGKEDSAIDSDVSDFCIVIKKRAFGMDPPKYVAMYKDRPQKIRDAYEIAMKLCVWYNCKAMLEYTKISIQKYFEQYKKSHLFMARPEFAVSNRAKRTTTKNLIGLPATEFVIKHGLELIEMYVEDYWQDIMFDEMLEQLLNYSYEEKRKFDIVAALSMCEIGDEAMLGFSVKNAQSTKQEWKDYGYYYDENGHKRFGIIPDKNNNIIQPPKWHF